MKLSNKKHNWALKTGILAEVIPVFALLFLVIANPDLFVEFYKETESDYFFGSKLVCQSLNQFTIFTTLFPFCCVKIFYHSTAMLQNFALHKEKIAPKIK